MDEAVKGGARVQKAAELIGISGRTVLRWRLQDEGDRRCDRRSEPANRLTAQEREKVLEIANSSKFRELSPKQIVPLLADDGCYVASESTFYRIMREEGQVNPRQSSRPAAPRPQGHVATGPCQVWSWDITYLKTTIRGQFFYLYLFLDVWSRRIVSAEVHPCESSEIGAQLFADTCGKCGIARNCLVLHSDNGSPMKGSTMLATLQGLGVAASFSRPHVSDDNPYSESLFRTLKYRPEYPSQPFSSIEEARKWVGSFVNWYNSKHLHSSIRFITPDDRHFGREEAILRNRKQVYQQARHQNPNRWAGKSRNWEPITQVPLNHKPQPEARLEKCA
jgi:transposase InsO family protein